MVYSCLVDWASKEGLTPELMEKFEETIEAAPWYEEYWKSVNALWRKYEKHGYKRGKTWEEKYGKVEIEYRKACKPLDAKFVKLRDALIWELFESKENFK